MVMGDGLDLVRANHPLIGGSVSQLDDERRDRQNDL